MSFHNKIITFCVSFFAVCSLVGCSFSAIGGETSEDPEGNLITYRYEAENCALINCNKIQASTASNGYCIGELFGYIGRGFVFNVSSNISTTAKIRFCMVQRTNDHTIDEWFSLLVNDTVVTLPKVSIPGCGSNYNAYSNWYSVDVVNCYLNQGINSIEILTANEHAANFDYVELVTDAVLTYV